MTAGPVAAPTRAELREQLVTSRIAGEVATPRENNLRNIGLCARRAPGYTFGLEIGERWTEETVLRLMVDRVGIDPDPAYRAGPDRIDPELTLDRLEAMGERLALAARRRERVLVATGHPAGILAIHLAVVAELARRGARLLTAGDGWSYETPQGEYREIRRIGGVAMVSDRGELRHTHSPRPMQGMLAELADGDGPPDLVVADHGWAGAAGQAGVATVGFADCNDPALFVGEADGKVLVTVPLDDNVAPHLYDPLTAFLLRPLRALGPGAFTEAG